MKRLKRVFPLLDRVLKVLLVQLRNRLFEFVDRILAFQGLLVKILIFFNLFLSITVIFGYFD